MIRYFINLEFWELIEVGFIEDWSYSDKENSQLKYSDIIIEEEELLFFPMHANNIYIESYNNIIMNMSEDRN